MEKLSRCLVVVVRFMLSTGLPLNLVDKVGSLKDIIWRKVQGDVPKMFIILDDAIVINRMTCDARWASVQRRISQRRAS